MSRLAHRIAAAPITWGVCEVPGWGAQIAAERYLADITAIGIHATELGPDGFLPTGPDELRRLLDRFDVRIVAGFVPAVLHRSETLDRELATVDRVAATLAGAGATVMVLGADTAAAGYETRPAMSDGDWAVLVKGLAEVQRIAERHGLIATLHPHWGMVVQDEDEIRRVLRESDIALCVDTGHLALAGADPLDIVRRFADRVRHVHLKDIDLDMAFRVRPGQLGYRDAVAAGLYRPLGHGGIDVAGIVGTLEDAGYGGWYVLEQDTVLTRPESTTGRRAAETSYRYLTEITGRTAGEPVPGGSPRGPKTEGDPEQGSSERRKAK